MNWFRSWKIRVKMAINAHPAKKVKRAFLYPAVLNMYFFHSFKLNYWSYNRDNQKSFAEYECLKFLYLPFWRDGLK